MEFVKVIEEYNRMCDFYCDEETGAHKCVDCSMCCTENGVDYCVNYLFDYPEEAEQRIMAWSHEHPPLIYPTMREVIARMVSKMGLTSINPESLDLRLNKEAADYFGIKPINEETLKGAK